MFSSFNLPRIFLNGRKAVINIRHLDRIYFSRSTTNLILDNKRSEILIKKVNKATCLNLLNTLNRQISQKEFTSSKSSASHKNGFWYILSSFVLMLGVTYAGVPLFKIFCESQGKKV